MTRIFPPLPPDSPLRYEWTLEGRYAPGHAIYELRPWPTAFSAAPNREALKMALKDINVSQPGIL